MSYVGVREYFDTVLKPRYLMEGGEAYVDGC